MEASAEQIAAFGRELSERMQGRPWKWMTQQLAEMLGEPEVSKTSMWGWLTGLNEPRRRRVFAMERILELPPGTLSRHLGYLPAEAVPLQDTRDVIEADPRLPPQIRSVLLTLYDALPEE